MFGASIKATTGMNRSFTTANMQITAENIDKTLQQVDESVQLAFTQKGVLQALQQPWGDELEAYETLHHALSVAVASDDTICYMSLCSDENGILSSQTNRRLPYTNATECRAYFDGLSSKYQKGGKSWFFLESHPIRSKEYAIVNVRKITPLGASRDELFLVVSVPERALATLYAFLKEDSYIVSTDGTIVSAVDKVRIGQKLSQELMADVLESGKDAAFLTCGNGMKLYSSYIPTIGCYLLSQEMNQVPHSTRAILICISLIVVAFGFAFSVLWAKYLARNLTIPLNELRESMERANNGDLYVRCQEKATDEFGYLSGTFNHMMDSINHYLEQLEEQQYIAKEAEIRLLQSQINPHLLYNTLDSALYLMSSGQMQLSISVLEQLSQYFKLALQSGNKIVTIDSAIRHMETYLRLQNLCRMKNYQFSVTGDMSLRNCLILHMVLQPIVENAVLHGFEGNFESGTIELNMVHEGNRVKLRVIDDGMGMDDETLETLQHRLKSNTASGRSFGLWNVAQRIKMYYGPAYGISIESEFGEYTAVTVSIPYVVNGVEEQNV